MNIGCLKEGICNLKYVNSEKKDNKSFEADVMYYQCTKCGTYYRQIDQIYNKVDLKEHEMGV